MQDYEKGQMYDAVDQTIWYETPQNGRGRDKIGYSDNLAASEHQRVEVNSVDGGHTTGTSTDLKPEYKRKARDADSKVIIRRYTVRRGGLKKSRDDRQRAGRKRKSYVSMTTSRRPVFRQKRLKKVKLLNNFRNIVHGKAVGLSADNLMKTQRSRSFRINKRNPDWRHTDDVREETASVGKRSESGHIRQINERTTNTRELETLKMADTDKSRQFTDHVDASQRDVLGSSLAAANNEIFDYSKLLVKKDVVDFFIDDADEYNLVQTALENGEN